MNKSKLQSVEVRRPDSLWHIKEIWPRTSVASPAVKCSVWKYFYFYEVKEKIMIRTAKRYATWEKLHASPATSTVNVVFWLWLLVTNGE